MIVFLGVSELILSVFSVADQQAKKKAVIAEKWKNSKKPKIVATGNGRVGAQGSSEFYFVVVHCCRR